MSKSSKIAAMTRPTGCSRPESLFGPWAVEPVRFGKMVETCKGIDLVKLAEARAIRADGAPGPGGLPTLSPETPGKKRRADADDGGDMMDDELDLSEANDNYPVVDGIAMLSMTGPMTKYQTSFQSLFGGCSTVALRRNLRLAAMDPNVNAVMLVIDSPGGTVAGASDLGADIRAVDAIKPCYAYCQDLAASAAYWAASQCRAVYANDSAMVGCIGSMSVLWDTSEQMKQEGIQVHVVTSDVPAGVTTAKGMGTDGTPVTPEVKAEVKRQLNDLNDLFVADVASGRSIPVDRVRAMADGRVHVGEKAKALGLVDEIASFDDAMQAVYTESYQMNAQQFTAFAEANPTDPAVMALINKGAATAKAEALAESRKQLAALQAAFPGREKFAIEQFAKGNDIIHAKAELSDVLQAEMASKPAPAAAADPNKPFNGVRMPMATETPGNAGGDPVAEFEAAWKGHVAKGMPQNKAIAKVVREQPQLHAAYLEANSGKGKKR